MCLCDSQFITPSSPPHLPCSCLFSKSASLWSRCFLWHPSFTYFLSLTPESGREAFSRGRSGRGAWGEVLISSNHSDKSWTSLLGLLCSQEWRCDLGHLSLSDAHSTSLRWAGHSLQSVKSVSIWTEESGHLAGPGAPKCNPQGWGRPQGEGTDKDAHPRLGDPALSLRLSAAPAGWGGPLTSGNDVP